MEKQTTIFHGANVEMIKESGAKTRHIYLNVNGKDVLHLIENENNFFNVFRYDLPYLRLCELMCTYDFIKIDHLTSFIRKSDLN